jgi:hypothetical protein
VILVRAKRRIVPESEREPEPEPGHGLFGWLKSKMGR